MSQDNCEHKFVHLETIKKYDSGGYQTRWICIDRFFCEKCLCEKEIKKEEYNREKPEWY